MARPVPIPSICRACRTNLIPKSGSIISILPRRDLSTTPSKRANDDFANQLLNNALRPRLPPRQQDRPAPPPRPTPTSSPYQPISESTQQPPYTPRPSVSNTVQNLISSANAEASTKPSSRIAADEPYHLNVYAHKHNMHITFTEPSRNPILSFSAGSLGLKKAQRSSYDAAYQLSTYTMRKLAEKQWRSGGKKMTMNKMNTLKDVRKIEVILRGFGPGREAFTKALLGVEGRMIKGLVTKVTDSTRLKFGGARSPQVRRLG